MRNKTKPNENTPIVDQLRNKKDRFFVDFVLMEKAADEIERLTREKDLAEQRLAYIKSRVKEI